MLLLQGICVQAQNPSADSKTNWLKIIYSMTYENAQREKQLTSSLKELRVALEKSKAEIDSRKRLVAALDRDAGKAGDKVTEERIHSGNAFVRAAVAAEQVASNPNEISLSQLDIARGNLKFEVHERSKAQECLCEKVSRLFCVRAEIAELQPRVDCREKLVRDQEAALAAARFQGSLLKAASAKAALGAPVHAKRLHYTPVYAAPSMGAARLWPREPSEGLEVLPLDGDWLLTLLPDGTQAWLLKSDVILIRAEPGTQQNKNPVN